MGKKGGARHLKRLPASKYWPIRVKENQWTIKPRAGPHLSTSSIPLAIVIRDFLHYAKNLRESKIILSEGRINVDGITRKDYRFPTGIMDIVDLPDAKSTYRVLPVQRRGLRLIQIPVEEKNLKLCRIEDKTTVKKGQAQLNLHDGRNILINITDIKKPAEDIYHCLDTVLLSVPENKIIKHFKFSQGAYIIVVKGRNLGREGRIKEIIHGTSTRPMVISIEDPQGNIFQTQGNYVFVVGDEEPAIRLGAS
ncbi:30S ribosomal protein S4e [[Eubacterium] cellulosolvens]